MEACFFFANRPLMPSRGHIWNPSHWNNLIDQYLRNSINLRIFLARKSEILVLDYSKPKFGRTEEKNSLTLGAKTLKCGTSAHLVVAISCGARFHKSHWGPSSPISSHQRVRARVFEHTNETDSAIQRDDEMPRGRAVGDENYHKTRGMCENQGAARARENCVLSEFEFPP